MATSRKIEHLREWKKIVCWDTTSEEPCPEIEFLEMLHYPDRKQPIVNKGILNDSSLSGWFSKNLELPFVPPRDLPSHAQACGKLQVYSGGQRLLFGVCNGDTESEERVGMLPFSNRSWDIIRDKLALPEQFPQYMIKKGSPSFKVSTPDHSGRSVICFIFKFILHHPGYYQLALSYDRKARLTHGLILAMTNKDQEFPRLLKGLQERRMYCEQPLILAALVTELVVDSCAARIDLVDKDLNTLEEESGLHGYNNRRKGNPLEMDFLRAIQTLHFANRTLGVDTIRLQFILPSLIQIMNETKKIASQEHDWPRGLRRAGTPVLVSDGRRMIEELVGYVKSSCENQLLRTRFQENRIQTQLTVVSRLMAQKDAKANIDIAKDTSFLARASKEDSAVMRTIAIEAKNDGSSIKTIAVLGMLFLPSTLIASLFSAPLFSWGDNGLPIANAGFKYYLAITLPLTILVLVLWAVVMLRPWDKWLSRSWRRSVTLDIEVLERNAAQSLG